MTAWDSVQDALTAHIRDTLQTPNSWVVQYPDEDLDPGNAELWFVVAIAWGTDSFITTGATKSSRGVHLLTIEIRSRIDKGDGSVLDAGVKIRNGLRGRSIGDARMLETSLPRQPREGKWNRADATTPFRVCETGIVIP